MAVMTRRGLIVGLSSLALAAEAVAATLPKAVVHKDPSCGCCGAWAEHLRAAGFDVETVETGRLNAVKARLGVPADLAACHTAEIGGYVVEGHVPAAAVKRLLAEKPPSARGLAVAGMPVGSPGMEVSGMEPDSFDVVLFGVGGERSVFARYRGSEPL